MDVYQIGEIVAGNGFVINEHPQICTEISYVVSGCCDFYSNGKVFHAKQGDIHVVSEGMIHSIKVGETDMVRIVYIGFLFRENNGEPLVNFYTNPEQKLCKEKNYIRTLFEQLLYEIYANQYCSFEAMEACVTQILIFVYRVFRSGEEVEYEKAVEEGRLQHIVGYTVYKIVRYIDNNILNIHSVHQIAEELNYNPTYLSRIFKEKMGIGIYQYIMKKKIEISKSMLKKDIRVSEIAYCLGYGSVESFCKAFYRCNGCTTSAWLKAERERSLGQMDKKRVVSEKNQTEYDENGRRMKE